MHSDSQNSHKNRVGMLGSCSPGAQKQDIWGKLTIQSSRISKVLVQGETLSQKVTWTAIEEDRGRTMELWAPKSTAIDHASPTCSLSQPPASPSTLVYGNGQTHASDWAFCPLLGSEEACKQDTGSVSPFQLFPCGLVRDWEQSWPLWVTVLYGQADLRLGLALNGSVWRSNSGNLCYYILSLSAKKDWLYILFIQVNNHHLPAYQEAQTDHLFLPEYNGICAYISQARNGNYRSLPVTSDGTYWDCEARESPTLRCDGHWPVTWSWASSQKTGCSEGHLPLSRSSAHFKVILTCPVTRSCLWHLSASSLAPEAWDGGPWCVWTHSLALGLISHRQIFRFPGLAECFCCYLKCFFSPYWYILQQAIQDELRPVYAFLFLSSAFHREIWGWFVCTIYSFVLPLAFWSWRSKLSSR